MKIKQIITSIKSPQVRGKVYYLPTAHTHVRDHPRRCGEKFSLFLSDHPRLGSPPQVRGKAFSVEKGLRDFGITPAGAGKRPTRHSYQARM